MGQFWAGKMRKTTIAIAESTEVLSKVKEAKIAMKDLRFQWGKQFNAVTTSSPGMALFRHIWVIVHSDLQRPQQEEQAVSRTHSLL
jgi:hypothetical protein